MWMKWMTTLVKKMTEIRKMGNILHREVLKAKRLVQSQMPTGQHWDSLLEIDDLCYVQSSLLVNLCLQKSNWKKDLVAQLPNKQRGLFHKDNYRRGRYFPGGAKCTFRGHEIPCYITTSPKGSIMSEILKDILRYIDNIRVFPQKRLSNSFLAIGWSWIKN